VSRAFCLGQQLADEADHIRVKLLVLSSGDEGRDPHRPDCVQFGEVALQDGQGVLCVRVVEQRMQLRRDVGRASAVVPDD